jgi:hypothetical protein
MNFRTTTLLFALLLSTLWIFGFMIARKKSAGDQTLITPNLNKVDAAITKIVVNRTIEEKDKNREDEYVFEQVGEDWYLKSNNQKARVEGFRIDGTSGLLQQIRDAKHDETVDIPRDAGMSKPQAVVTLSGKYKDEPKEWKFTIGKESPDKAFAYVASSEKPEKVFAVPMKNLSAVLFTNPDFMRSKRIFDFMDTAVNSVQVKKGDRELELQRGESAGWEFVKPPLGPAGEVNEVVEEKKEKDPFHKEPPPVTTTGGVKGLLNSIKSLLVEDDEHFEPLGRPLAHFGLEKGKENMRIDIHSTNDKKERTTETLYIGSKVPGRAKEEFYYARLATDDGVMQISARRLEPVLKALEEPGKLRSTDIAVFDEKKVDAVVIQQGKDEIKFFKPAGEKTQWQMFIDGKKKLAYERAVDSLIEQAIGKKAIVAFHDVPSDELKKNEAAWGLDNPTAVIKVYLDAIDKDKKDEKKADKVDPKKETKKDEPKKDSSGEAMPHLKENARPVVTLAIGKTEGDHVHVRRTLEDGKTQSWFTVKKELVEKVLPSEGIAIAYLDTSLPTFEPENVQSMKLQRTTDKGPETLEFVKKSIEGKSLWYVKDALDPSGMKPAADNHVQGFINSLGKLEVKKWVRELGEKEDLDKLGLKTPGMVLSVQVKKLVPNASAMASLAGAFVDPSVLTGVFSLIAQRETDKGETITVEIGKETDNDKDKPGYFAKHSGSKLLFLVPTQMVDVIKTTDMVDRSAVFYAQPKLAMLYGASASISPINALMFASPHFTGIVHQFDADKVKEVKLEVRTPFELRSFHFAREGKDKSWSDKSNLKEFQLDSDKVNRLLKDIGKLRTDRFAAYTGGPRSDHKLSAKEATAKFDLVMDDGKTITLTIGASFQGLGHFAHSTAWPDAVFFVPETFVNPLTQGARAFAKERSAAE